jgi:putative transposase
MGTFRTYKYRIYPTKAQATNLENQFSMCRHLYNWALLERKEAYLEKGKTVTYKQQQNALPKMKEKRPWFKTVYSQVLQDVLRRIDRAYLSFFRRVKNGDSSGFPKYKKHGQWNSITYPQYKERPDSIIRAPKLGNLKLKLHRPLPEIAEVKMLTITKEFGKWFACFSAAVDGVYSAPRGVSGFSRSIDLGLIDFVEAYDAHFKSAPRFQRLIKRIARLKGKLHQEEKRSKEWCRCQKAIEKVRFKLKCLQTDFLHKETNRLLLKSNMILLEDLNVSTLESTTHYKEVEKKDRPGYYSNLRTNDAKKKIADVGWYMFLQILRYKASDQGKQILTIPTQYITGICINCGTIFRKVYSKSKQYCQCGCPRPQEHKKIDGNSRIGLDTLAAETASMPRLKKTGNSHFFN